MVQAEIAQHLQAALGHLKSERAHVEERIASIEQLIVRQGAAAKATAKSEPAKRRGRPPKAVKVAAKPAKPVKAAKPAKPAKAVKAAPAKKAAPAAKAAGKVRRRKPEWSASARAAARERMQKYWADRRKKGN